MTTAKSPVYKLNNGIEMPAVGLGVFHSEPETTVAAVQAAVANGCRLIDTAAAYVNERQVGEGVRALCNFSASHLDTLIELTGHIPAVNQVELHPFFSQPELREADKKHGIITQA
jgi:diketogulonate reductase-like aldo/keto reductase